MNEQPQDNTEETGGEENRYNESNQPNKEQQPATNKSGIEEDTSALHLGDTTLQSPQEFKSDKEGDHSNEDEEISVSGDDNELSTATSFAGDQAAAVADGEDDDTSNLNQGLEDQNIEKYE